VATMVSGTATLSGGPTAVLSMSGEIESNARAA